MARTYRANEGNNIVNFDGTREAKSDVDTYENDQCDEDRPCDPNDIDQPLVIIRMVW